MTKKQLEKALRKAEKRRDQWCKAYTKVRNALWTIQCPPQRS